MQTQTPTREELTTSVTELGGSGTLLNASQCACIGCHWEFFLRREPVRGLEVTCQSGSAFFCCLCRPFFCHVRWTHGSITPIAPADSQQPPGTWKRPSFIHLSRLIHHLATDARANPVKINSEGPPTDPDTRELNTFLARFPTAVAIANWE